jgi:ABC-type multidrug transport system fused ATPase/permease subunit
VLKLLFSEISKKRIALLLGSLLLVNMMELLGLSLFIPILEFLQKDAETENAITILLSSMLKTINLNPSLPMYLGFLSTLFILKAAITLRVKLLSVTMASELQHNLRMRLFSVYSKSNLEFINTQRQGVLLSVLNEHIVRASSVFNVLVQILLSWMTALVYIIFVIIISWQLTFIALFVGLLVVPIIRKIGDLAQYHGANYTTALEDAQHFALETLQAKKLINAMGWGSSRIHSYQRVSDNVSKTWMSTAFWSNSPSIIIQPISVIILSLLIVLSVNFELSISLLGAFILAFLRLLPTIQSALSSVSEVKAHLPSVRRVQELHGLAESQEEHSGNVKLKKIANFIVLEKVQFSYKTAVSCVLQEVDMVIPQGSTVALVGSSGSGKTTIADLILGLYQPDHGRIVIDDIDLKDINLGNYRSKVAYIPQEPILFHDTIRANLMMGLSQKIDDAELQDVCVQSGAWGFIVDRPKGLEEIIGDRGVQLSGGQRQRLAFARALLRKPELLILDEATSALDYDSEEWIQETLKDMSKTRMFTLIIIAHRYATIRHADIIFEITHGKAVNLGNWETASAHLKKKSESMGIF